MKTLQEACKFSLVYSIAVTVILTVLFAIFLSKETQVILTFFAAIEAFSFGSFLVFFWFKLRENNAKK